MGVKAQGNCEPGLTNIPNEVTEDDWLDPTLWVNAGDQIYANLETNPNTGILTGVKIIRPGFETVDCKIVAYDENRQLLGESGITAVSGSPNLVDTLQILGLTVPIPVPTTYYVGIKYQGSGSIGLLRKFTTTSGESFAVQNFFNENFQTDLSAISTDTDVLYAIWGVVEDCESAATCADVDFNGDQSVNVAELTYMLGVFGQIGTVPGDVDGNGVVNSGDLGAVLTLFGCNY